MDRGNMGRGNMGRGNMDRDEYFTMTNKNLGPHASRVLPHDLGPHLGRHASRVLPYDLGPHASTYLTCQAWERTLPACFPWRPRNPRQPTRSARPKTSRPAPSLPHDMTCNRSAGTSVVPLNAVGFHPGASAVTALNNSASSATANKPIHEFATGPQLAPNGPPSATTIR
jgi:hypothetical protein